MKSLIVFVAIVALAAAGVARKEKKEKEELQMAPGSEKFEGLPVEHMPWPMPDPLSEGDLMLHGSISYERVRELHKAEKRDDVDKIVLAHGRSYLRRVAKFFDENADFKVSPIICRDSRALNSTINRWRMEIPRPAAPPALPAPANDSKDAEKPKEIVQRDVKEKGEKQPEKAEDQPQIHGNASLANETETTTTVKPTEKPTDKPADSNSTANVTEQPEALTTLKPEIPEEKDSYEARRNEFYREAGGNFARLLVRESQKRLNEEETAYLARFLADESVHYGAMAIYCSEGENIKEIKKQLAVFLEEKAQ